MRCKQKVITAVVHVSLAVFAILASPSATHAQGTKNETIKIGVSGPFTGGSSPMGESMRNGIRLAVEEINSLGGVYGKKIELIERDDEAKPEIGAKIAQEFTYKRVAAAIGIVNTGVGLASIDTYQKAKIPLMIAVSTGTSLTQKYAPPAAPENYIFRVSPTLDLEAKVLASDILRHGMRKVAILADSTAYGEAGMKAFLAQCKLNDMEVSGEGRFNIGDKDMSAQVQKMKASGAQVLVVWGIGPELAVIAKNKEAAKWRVPLYGSWTFSMENFIDGAGSAGEGALMPQSFIQNIDSTSQIGFLLAYTRSFKNVLIPSPMSAAAGYDGMHLLFAALLQANSTEGEKIKNALESLKNRHLGVITNYTKPFSKLDHDAITPNMMLMGRVTSGRVTYAYVEDQKRGVLMRRKNSGNNNSLLQ